MLSSPPHLLLVLCNQDPFGHRPCFYYGDDWGIRNPECDPLQLLNYFPNPKSKSGKLQGDDSHHLSSRKILLAIQNVWYSQARSGPILASWGPSKDPRLWRVTAE